ncbi:MAG: ABC transporter permease subunit [Thermoplasmata archaeon]|nr:ABC transporter permease subunit [Thermoplasmata archaeon]
MSAVPTAGWVVPESELTDAEVEALWEGGGHSTSVLSQRLRATPSIWVGGGLLSAYILVGVAAVLAYGDSLTQMTLNPFLGEMLPPPGPSHGHPFGVMGGTGIDLLDAILRATPVDLALLGGILGSAVGIGVVLGAYAGYDAGIADDLVTFVGDIVGSVPPFFLVLVLFLGVQQLVPPDQGVTVFGCLFAIVLWPYYARPVRARAQQVSHEAYIEAAQASGASRPWMLARHVIPNSFYPVLAQIPVDVYNVFFVLTVFPFLGCFGGGAGHFYATLTPLPSTSVYPEWGNLLATGACEGWSFLAQLDWWWMYTFPALAILGFGIAVALSCDGVEKVLRAGRIS